MIMLDSDFVETISSPLYRTFQAIGADLYEMEPNLDNESAIECTIDADRIDMYGGTEGPTVNSMIRAAIKEHGYTKVIKFLNQHFSLA